MDVECYFAEKMMRERISEVRANAEVARLLRQSNECSRPSHGLRKTFIDLSRSLVNELRKKFAKVHVRCNVGRQSRTARSNAPWR